MGRSLVEVLQRKNPPIMEVLTGLVCSMLPVHEPKKCGEGKCFYFAMNYTFLFPHYGSKKGYKEKVSYSHTKMSVSPLSTLQMVTMCV